MKESGAVIAEDSAMESLVTEQKKCVACCGIIPWFTAGIQNADHF